MSEKLLEGDSIETKNHFTFICEQLFTMCMYLSAIICQGFIFKIKRLINSQLVKYLHSPNISLGVAL
jgi:hypothetical protein